MEQKVTASRHLKKITFIDSINFEKLHEFMKNYQVFIHPSCYTDQRDCEGGAPIAILDAQATGMPVISTTHCDIPDEVIDKMVGYAERARREGMLALEEDSENESDPFLRKGLRLAVDGTDPQLLEKILETDVEQIENRHGEGAKVLSAGGTFAPAFGMIGTLIGLVNMLSNLDDPTQIGAGMATALITTFYGAVLANAVFLPLAGKLETRSKEELVIKAMIIEGIMAIQSGDSPRIVEEKLKSFLSPAQRAKVEEAKEQAA